MRKCRKAYEIRYWRRIDVRCRGMKRVRILKSKAVRREAKKEVGQANNKTYDELYEGLYTKEGEKTLY